MPLVLNIPLTSPQKPFHSSRCWNRSHLPQHMERIEREIARGLLKITVPELAYSQDCLSNTYQKLLNLIHRTLESTIGVRTPPTSIQYSGELRQLTKQRDRISKALLRKHSPILQEALRKTQQMIQNVKRSESTAGYFDWKSSLSASTNTKQAKLLSRLFKNRTPVLPHQPPKCTHTLRASWENGRNEEETSRETPTLPALSPLRQRRCPPASPQ